MNRMTVLLALLALGACARSEDTSVAVDSNEMRRVEQVRTPEQDDIDIAIGEWRDAIQGDSRALEFGPSGAPPVFSLRCDERRGIVLQRHGTVPIGDLPMMLVTLGNDTRRLAVTTTGGAIPMLRASIPPADPFLETLASTPATMTIRVGDSAPLILPESPQVGTFVTNCASGGGGVAPAAEAEEAAPEEALTNVR